MAYTTVRYGLIVLASKRNAKGMPMLDEINGATGHSLYAF